VWEERADGAANPYNSEACDEDYSWNMCDDSILTNIKNQEEPPLANLDLKHLLGPMRCKLFISLKKTVPHCVHLS